LSACATSDRESIGDRAASPEDRGVVNLTQEFAMGTDAISPLRQRMIEDMSARQLHPVTQKGHVRLQAVCGIPEALARDRYRRGYSSIPAAAGRERDEHLQSQPHHDGAQVPVPRDAAALGAGTFDFVARCQSVDRQAARFGEGVGA
jgi:hypothetical protein